VILFSVVISGGKIDREKMVGLVLTFIGLYVYDINRKEISKGEMKIASMQEQEAVERLPLHRAKE
jgi:hypothetical protein